VYGATGTAASGAGSEYWYNLFGSSAFAAKGTDPIRALAVGGDGTLYVSPGELFDGGGMFRISTGGVILPLLSNGPITGAGQGYNPADTNNAALIQGDEGKLATQVTSGANATRTIAVGPDGSVYFTPDDQIVWRIDPDGILERFAGRYASTTYDPPNYPADGADPLNTYLYPVTQLAVTPDNTVVLIREDAAQLPEILLYPVRTAAQGLLATPAETQNIPSEDGSEIYVFSIDGRHLSTLDGLTGATKWSFGYDTNSLVVTMTDGAGLTTLITRDGTGNPTAIVGPYGQVTALGLDGNGFLSTVSNPANETTTLASTSGGLLSSVTGPLGETYKVSYDSLGRVTQVTDPLGGGWIDAVTNVGFLGDMSYEVNVDCTNSSGDTLTRVLVLEPDGSTSEVYYTGGLGTEGTRVALNGNETINVADGSYGFVGVGADPRFGSQVSQPNYSLLQLPSNVTLTASAQLSAGLAVNGDPLSLTGLTNVTTVNGNSYTQVYNASNHTLAITSPAGKNSITASDSLGRINHIVAPGQPTVDLAYDTNGRLVFETNTSAAGAALTTFSYNALGQISTVTDALGRANGFAYTAAGRLQQQTLPDGSIVGLTEDSEGNLTSVTPPGRPAHTFQYNNAGLLTKYTPPLVGTDESATFQYDSERYITQASLPDGQAEVYSYGPNHQLQQLTLGSGAILSYQYGTNFGSGYLSPAAITSSTGEGIQFGYTASIRTMETWSGTIAGQFTVQLNNNLLAASRSVNGSSVSYGYDPDQMLIQAGNMSLTRDPAFGFITGTTLGAAADQRGYDDRGLLTNYSAGANGIPLWSMNLSYDLIRRLTNKVETIAGQTQTFGYVYDLAGRLQQVSLNGAVNSAYTYDTNGNRLTRNDETATYDAQDRVLTYAGSNFTWSSDGNLLTAAAGGQTTTYSYDVRGVLLSAALPGSQVDYVIDPLGHRVGKQLGGVLEKGWLWDGIVPVAEVDANSSVTARFVYAADGTTPSFMVTGSNTYRIYSDERGSVRLVVNQTDGSVAQQLNYDEFGRVTLDTSPGFQPFGYAGGLYDPDTGLVHFGLRDYSPALGRWLQRDPISFAGGDFSLFNYVYNDPINLSDPTGCGPMQKLRQAALNGNPRAQVAYQNLLKANQNIATGEGEDALKSVKAYNNAIRVSNASIAVLGTAGGISAVYSGVAVFTSVGGAVTATQAAGGTFLVMNGLVGTGGNIANVAINGLGAPSGQAVNATAPTSIAQGVLPAGPAAAVDLILAQKLPSPSNVPAWVSTANDWSGASDKVANSQTLLGQ
jgi:RHS repeat-associated protein